jgi:hypothetical protein
MMPKGPFGTHAGLYTIDQGFEQAKEGRPKALAPALDGFETGATHSYQLY